jgi:hypothetical protein
MSIMHLMSDGIDRLLVSGHWSDSPQNRFFGCSSNMTSHFPFNIVSVFIVTARSLAPVDSAIKKTKNQNQIIILINSANGGQRRR